MRRRFLILALAIGTVGGYAAGFRSMRHCNYQRTHGWDRGYGSEGFDRGAYRDGFAAGARACAEGPNK
jgi:hypothetical protein